MKTKILPVLLLTLAMSSVAPLMASAQGGNAYVGPVVLPPDTKAPISINGGNDVLGLLRIALNWFAIAFWIFAAGFIFYAAYLFLFAGHTGDNKKGKSALIYAIIAIIIGIIAYGLPNAIQQFVSGK